MAFSEISHEVEFLSKRVMEMTPLARASLTALG